MNTLEALESVLSLVRTKPIGSSAIQGLSWLEEVDRAWLKEAGSLDAPEFSGRTSALLGMRTVHFVKEMARFLSLDQALERNLVCLHKKSFTEEIPQEITHQLVDFWSRNEASKSLLLEFASPELWTTALSSRARASALYNSLRENFFDLIKACSAHEPLATYSAAADWVSKLNSQPEIAALDKAIPELLSSY